MPAIGSKKTIDGRRYRLERITPAGAKGRQQAAKLANTWRQDHGSARVVGGGGRWRVYILDLTGAEALAISKCRGILSRRTSGARNTPGHTRRRGPRKGAPRRQTTKGRSSARSRAGTTQGKR